MKFEEIEKLEEGTLLKIKGSGFFGKVDRLTTYKAANLKRPGAINNKHTGYMLGCTLYPLDWIKLATKKECEENIAKLTEEYQKAVAETKAAYEKAEKARKAIKK